MEVKTQARGYILVDSSFFIISLVLFVVAIALLIVYSFMQNIDILWIIGTGIFIFAVVLCDNNVISSFIAILLSSILLIIFSKERNIIYCLSLFFVLIGGIVSILSNYIWLIIAFIPSYPILFVKNTIEAGPANKKITVNNKAAKEKKANTDVQAADMDETRPMEDIIEAGANLAKQSLE